MYNKTVEVVFVNDRLEMDIRDIKIIIHKSEKGRFHFENKCRAFDGFVMITSGEGRAIDFSGKSYDIGCGDLIIVNKGDRYSIDFDEDCSYVTSGLTLVTDKSRLPFIHKCSEHQQHRVMELCMCWQSRSRDSEAVSRVGLMDLYLQIIGSNAASEDADSDISKALDFIHSNFRRNFSGAELSEYCSVSLSYLRAKCIQRMGKTIVQYRDSLRIASAKEMLESGIYTVSEIAVALGYCDVYHFSKSFSARVGVAPSKWR